MNNTAYNVTDIILTAGAGAFSIEYIETALGIVLLILTIINILIKAGFTIYNAIKNKNYKQAADEFDSAVKDLREEIKSNDQRGI